MAPPSSDPEARELEAPRDDALDVAEALTDDRPDDALTRVRRLAEREDDPAWGELIPCLEAFSAGRLEEAWFRASEEVERASEVDAELYAALARALERAGEALLAAAAWAEVGDGDGDRHAARLREGLGVDAEDLAPRVTERAVAHYQRRLAEAPGDTLAREALGRAHLALGRPAEALSEAERALALDDGNLWAWLLLSDALEGMGRAEEAASRLEGALRTHPDRVELRLERARLLEGPLAHPEDALELYREALEREPGEDRAVAGIRRLEGPRTPGRAPLSPVTPAPPSPRPLPSRVRLPGERLGWIVWGLFILGVGSAFLWWSLEH